MVVMAVVVVKAWRRYVFGCYRDTIYRSIQSIRIFASVRKPAPRNRCTIIQ